MSLQALRNVESPISTGGKIVLDTTGTVLLLFAVVLMKRKRRFEHLVLPWSGMDVDVVLVNFITGEVTGEKLAVVLETVVEHIVKDPLRSCLNKNLNFVTAVAQEPLNHNQMYIIMLVTAVLSSQQRLVTELHRRIDDVDQVLI